MIKLQFLCLHATTSASFGAILRFHLLELFQIGRHLGTLAVVPAFPMMNWTWMVVPAPLTVGRSGSLAAPSLSSRHTGMLADEYR